MKHTNSSPTMKDVAREAGVALGTVSKVFNGIPVGESYRIKVEQAALKLGYQVNSYARGLKAGKTGTVALILPGINNPFFAALAQYVCVALAKRGYRMLLTVTDAKLQTEQQCITMAQQNKVDGIIGLTYNPSLRIDERVPFVTIDRYFSPSVPCVSSDNFGGGQMAAERLISLGCQKLLYLHIGSSVPGEVNKRGDGFEAMCQMKGKSCQSLRLWDQDGVEGIRPFLTEHFADGARDYDGIFCCTDHLAHHVQRMLMDLGVRVPEEVQMIGFDGVRQFGDEALYCSTIAQPIAQLAETSVDLLLREDRSSLPSLICLPVSYLSGGTTKDE